jgi:hypothetical protein
MEIPLVRLWRSLGRPVYGEFAGVLRGGADGSPRLTGMTLWFKTAYHQNVHREAVRRIALSRGRTTVLTGTLCWLAGDDFACGDVID